MAADALVAGAITAQTAYFALKDGIRCANATAVAAAEAAGKFSAQAVITGLITGAGLYKQYEALGKQGDLFEAQKEVALRNIALAERTFNDTFMPSYKAATDYFEKNFRKQWEPVLVKVVACGIKECEYVEDYERHTAWAVADADKVVRAAQKSARSIGACSVAGTCFTQDYRFAELKARLVVDAKNLGRAFEDDLKPKKDTFYWNRLTTTASISQNIGSLASNIMINGKGSLISGLSTISQASTGLDAAVASGFSTLANQGAFYGGLGASVNGLFNGRDANRDAQALTSQSTTRSLPAGAEFLASLSYNEGPVYSPVMVDISPASVDTRNRSGLETTGNGVRVRTN